MVSKKAVVLKMAVPVLLLILLLDMSATARAEHVVEFLKKFTSKNHQALSEYKSGCCNDCNCVEIGSVQECSCGDWYAGSEACKKLKETCELVLSPLIYPPRCVCADITTSCTSCTSINVGAGGAVDEAFIIKRAA